MAVIGGLLVALGVNTARFQSDLDKAGRLTQNAQKGMDRSFRRVGDSMNNVGRTARRLTGIIAGLAGVGGFGALVKSGFSAAESLANVADTLGLSTERLAGLRFAAEQTNISVQTFDMAIQRMRRRIAEAAQGTGEAQAAIKQLGLDAVELSRLPLDEQFFRIADAMTQVDNQGERLRLGFKLFDSEGARVVRTLALGSEGLERMQNEAQALGVALTRVDAAKIEVANAAFRKIRTAVSGVAQQVAIGLAPAITSVAERVVALAKDYGGFGSLAIRVTGGVTSAIEFMLARMKGIEVLIDLFDIASKKIQLTLSQISPSNVERFRRGGLRGLFFGLGEEGERQLREDLDKSRAAQEAMIALDMALSELVKDLADLDTAGASVREFFTQLAADIQAQAEQIARSAPGGGAGGFIPLFDPASVNAQAAALDAQQEKLREHLSDKIIAIRQGFLNEREAAVEHFVELATLTAEARDNDVISQMEQQQLLKDLWFRHEAEVAAIRIEGESRANRTILAMRRTLGNQIVGLLRSLAGQSKAAAIAAIALQKGLAIAETIMNTQVAAMRALAELGPIAGPPAAAAIKALGAASVAIIAAQGLAEAASLGRTGASLGSAANPVNVTPAPGTEAITATETQPVQRIVNVQVRGIVIAEWVREELIPPLLEAIGDGALRIEVQTVR